MSIISSRNLPILKKQSVFFMSNISMKTLQAHLKFFQSLLLSFPTLGMRHVQALLAFLNMTVIYISRLNIGVAVVAMTNADTTNPNFLEFNWTEKEISYILSSFFWGYILTQFIGGVLCRHFGTVMTMGISTLATAILSALMPLCATRGGWQAFCAIRFVMGLFQGVMFPCIFQHLAEWTPLEERNRLCGISLTGVDFGVVMAMGLPGLIAAGPLGWPGIFYVSTGLCVFWCIFWFIFAANNATESRFISEQEKHYIESSLKRGEDFHKKKIPVPWKALLTSIPFISVVIARCAAGWGVSTMQAQIPAYLHGVLHMDIKANALFSALPFAVTWAMSYVFVIIADIIQNKNILNLTQIRKTFNTISFWVPAAGLIAIGFLSEEHKTWAIVLLIVNVGVNSGGIIGSGLNIIDLSPNHTGILMGIINTLGNCMPVISPLVVGVIVSDKHNRFQWQIVFAIAAVIFFFGNLIYIIYGSALAQPWNDPDFLVPKNAESMRMEEEVGKNKKAALNRP